MAKILPFVRKIPTDLFFYSPPLSFYGPSITSLLWSSLCNSGTWSKPVLKCADNDMAQAIVDGVNDRSVAILDMYRDG